MNKYSPSFIIGWSIGFTILLVLNVLLFFAPLLDSLVTDLINSLGTAAVIVYLLLWPVLLFGTGLAVFGMIIAITVDIVVLLIFYLSMRNANNSNL